MTEVWEFYAPFAHIEGKYEWCRIRTTTHGIFDTFILFPYSEQVTVYVVDDAGEQFMRDRYPECDTYRPCGSRLRSRNRVTLSRECSLQMPDPFGKR